MFCLLKIKGNAYSFIEVDKETNTSDIMSLNLQYCFLFFRQVVQGYCIRVSSRLSQHCHRAEIISEVYSLKELLKHFPVTCDAHFIFGEEEDLNKKNEPNDLFPVPG